MNQPAREGSANIQSAYNEQYTNRMSAWRELGGKYKAQNIMDVCKNRRFHKVLECGAGEGSVLKFLDAAGVFPQLYAVEISSTAIEQINQRGLKRLLGVKEFNGYEIPYPDKEFDMAYCSHVLEHVEHPRTLLRELRRVSKYQVFEVPLDYSIGVDKKAEHFLSYGHINIYTPSLFRFLLKSEGYDILEEVLTSTRKEVARYNLYNNMNVPRTVRSEVTLALRSFRSAVRRFRLGRRRCDEYGYSAYTCLAEGVRDLRIF